MTSCLKYFKRIYLISDVRSTFYYTLKSRSCRKLSIEAIIFPLGDYSESSMPILAASSPSKPIISMGMLARDLVVMVGEPAKLLVPYAASPRPEIAWTKNGLPVSADSRTEIETNDYLSVLSYKKAERSDAGTYAIKVDAWRIRGFSPEID